MTHQYQWQRYWKPLRDADDGDLESEASAISLEEIEAKPVLILLGAPGLGKTHELRRAFESAQDAGERATFVYLRRIGSPADLAAELAPLLEAVSPQRQTLFFDGFDESSVPFATLASWITSALRKLCAVNANLRLRITSRAPEWSKTLEEDLRTLWDGASVASYVLQPLSEEDIAEVSGAANGFSLRIQELGLQALAQRPVTLRMLWREFVKNQDLPDSAVQLYASGIRATVEEQNSAHEVGEEPTNQIELDVRILGRIAATSILCGKPQIWTGLYSGARPEASISVADVVGGYETIGSVDVRITEGAVRNAIRRGPLSPTAPDTFEWAHQTFAEFLAAEYLATKIQGADAILDILSSREIEPRSIFPQLGEIAVWIAGLDGAFRRLLLQTDPHLLVFSDMTTATDDDRRQLVHSLLRRLSEYELHDNWSDPRVSYRRFNHPGLAAQLGPLLRDITKNNIVRRFAIEVAVECVAIELISDLKDIAQNTKDDEHIRSNAVRALGKIGTVADKNELKALLGDDHLGEDENDEIRGELLKALWPQQLSFAELFSVLTPRKKDNFLGSYWSFLHKLAPHFKDSRDALIGVQWLIKHVVIPEDGFEHRHLEPRILTQALSFADDGLVLEAIAELYVEMARKHRFFGDQQAQEDIREQYRILTWSTRQKLLSLVLKRAGPNEKGMVLWRVPWPLVDVKDLKELARDIGVLEDPMIRENIIAIVTSMIRGHAPEDVAEAWDISLAVPALVDVLREIYSVRLDSAFARYEQGRIIKSKVKSEPTRHWTVELDQLVATAHEKPNEWWRIDFALLGPTENASSLSDFSPNLTAGPRWRELSSHRQSELVGLARSYLIDGALTDDSWIGSQTWHRPAAAGYRAARLLAQIDVRELASLPADAWKKWMSAILGFSGNSDENERLVQSQIWVTARRLAPEAFASALQRFVDANSFPFGFERLISETLDSEVCDIVWKAVTAISASTLASNEEELAARPLHLTASLLVERRFPPAVVLAHKALDSDSEKLSPTLLVLASALTLYSPNDAWPRLHELMSQLPVRVRDLLLRIGDQIWRGGSEFLSRLSEKQLADLYNWIRQLGIERRDMDGSFGWVTPVDKLADLRNAALNQLKARGTASAATEIERLCEANPDETWLRFSLEEARANRRKEAWRPFTPTELRAVLGGTEYLVSGGNLKDAIRAKASADLREPSKPRISEPLIVAESFQIPTEQVPKDAPQSISAKKVFVVADEWASSRGGISTFNRNLCKALAAAGCPVQCMVLDATEAERADAARFGVVLVVPDAQVGIRNHELLLTWKPDGSFVPDVVVGHDHITGKYARFIAKNQFDNIPFAHVVHTVPEDIEPYKGGWPAIRRDGNRGYVKGSLQRELCESADLIVAVGPMIEDAVRGDLANRADGIMCLIPGYDPDLAILQMRDHERLPLRVLFVGRAEDPELKGIDVVFGIAEALGKVRIDGARTPEFCIRGSDGSETERFFDLHKKLNRKSVRLRPFSTDAEELRNELVGASCLIMPSRTEGFGLVALEALAAGVPILVTSSSGFARHLLQVDAKFQLSKGIVDECILEVEDDVERSVEVWCEALKAILVDRNSSFQRAAERRAQLERYFDWQTSIVEFLAEVDKACNRNLQRKSADIS